MTTLAIAEILEDPSVYPRHAVDSLHVTSLVDALKTGATLPPLIVDADTKRLVDGWHRIKAYRRVLGSTGTVDVELRRYATEGDLLLDAIALNATHGRRLDHVDQVRSVMLGERAGLTDIQVATVLHVPTERIPTLRIRVATVPTNSTDDVVPGTDRLVLKRPVAHLAGTMLTADQANAMHAVPGTSFLLVTRQLLDALRYDLANRDDERLMAALVELRNELARYLGSAGKAGRSKS